MADTDTGSLEAQNIALVTRFCKAWETRDIAAVLEFVDDAIFYQMWDADDAIKVEGKAAFEKVVGGFLAGTDTVEFDITRTQGMGKIVINERIDPSTVRAAAWCSPSPASSSSRTAGSCTGRTTCSRARTWRCRGARAS